MYTSDLDIDNAPQVERYIEYISIINRINNEIEWAKNESQKNDIGYTISNINSLISESKPLIPYINPLLVVNFTPVIEMLKKLEYQGALNQVKNIVTISSSGDVHSELSCFVQIFLIEKYEFTKEEIGITVGSSLAQRLDLEKKLARNKKDQVESNKEQVDSKN